MDFFAHQDRARAASRRLAVLYALSVLGVVITLNVVAAIVMGSTVRDQADRLGGAVLINWPLHAITTSVTLAIIAIATLVKQTQLGGDGANVAELLGGRAIVGTPTDLGERRLMNVVEEMSLASGVPMPRVYVLDGERGINAFAAGTRTDNAVVAVTRGTLECLSRDELQGVVAHEFSHILNGDMRLNLRLIALNFGIMAIGYIGLQILRHTPRASSRRSGKDNNAPILLFAIAMLIIGYVGTFFGKMLQAAMSRQREYLADAAAVQFTRNPNGIAGALKRIGGYKSDLETPNAGEASHLFFADGVVGFLDGLFATHPPLDQRIRAIEPNFDGKMTPRNTPIEIGPEESAGAMGFVGRAMPPPLPGEGERVRVTAEQIEAAASDAVVPSRAASLAVAIPESIRRAVREPFDARAVVVALLLDRDAAIRDRQRRAIANADEVAAQASMRYRDEIDPLGPAARLPILELAMPALRRLSTSQQAAFRHLCRTLASADQVLSPFELSLLKIVDQAMPADANSDDAAVHYASVSAVAEEVSIFLSALAATGGEHQARRAFDAGMARLQLLRPVAYDSNYDRERFDRALSTLRRATPSVRRRIVDAAAHTVAVDGLVLIEEMELMRAACAAFDVPIPPMLDRA